MRSNKNNNNEFNRSNSCPENTDTTTSFGAMLESIAPSSNTPIGVGCMGECGRASMVKQTRWLAVEAWILPEKEAVLYG